MPIDLTQSNFPSRKSAVFINPPTLETVKIRPRETANTGGRTTILQPHSLNTLPCSSFGLASYPDSSQHCDPFDNFFSSDGHIPQCAEPVVPLPQRPGMAAGGFALARPMLQTALKRSPILKTKLDLGDSLSNSCIYSQNKGVDSIHWTGNHQEDSIAEQIVKSGFQNKPLLTNEMSTAKPSLWLHFKNKAGLQTLSCLFTNILEKRQASGRLSIASTFKPPPRVTLNSTKREAWLRDLSMPSHPLRRLNRKIPYGISGKSLLEQCLTKRIPTARAVWLAQCVGANDIRAFKRKGATGAVAFNGESKWVRDWTMQVELFLESTFSNVADAAWKFQVEYVLRLATHLYSEHLLDHNHYLEWLLTSLETCPQEQLPVWLMLAEIHWNNLVRTRLFGHRLSEALLHHLQCCQSTADSDILSPISKRISELLMKLSIAHKSCFVGPKAWKKYSDSIQNLGEAKCNLELREAVYSIIERNNRLCIDNVEEDDKSRQLFMLLDSAGSAVNVRELASDCLALSLENSALISSVLHWASSVYRSGAERVYVAAHLLRTLKKNVELDLNVGVWTFLTNFAPVETYEENKLHKVIVELVRVEVFSVACFLQSLVSTGLFTRGSSVDGAPRRLVRLLGHLPMHGLQEHHVNLRNILLDAVGITLSDQNVAYTICQVVGRKPLHLTNPLFQQSADLDGIISKMTPSVKLEAGLAVRDQFMSTVRLSNNEPGFNEQSSTTAAFISLNEFLRVRDTLEKLQETPPLADVLSLALECMDVDVLTSVSDTLQYHFCSLETLGASKILLVKLLDCYRQLRKSGSQTKALCVSIMAVCSLANSDQAIIQLLTGDVMRCDELIAASMCSPASDNAGEVMQGSAGLTVDDIDRVLSSGTAVDEHMLGRIFQRICAVAAEHHQSGRGHIVPLGRWLARLREFDEAVADELIKTWIEKLFDRSTDMLYSLALPSAIGARCMLLESFARLAEAYKAKLKTMDHVDDFRFSITLLSALIPTSQLPALSDVPQAYRYRLEREKFACTFPYVIISQIQRVLDFDPMWLPAADHKHLVALLGSRPLVAFVQSSIQHGKLQIGDAHGLFMSGSSMRPFADVLIDKLLDPNDAFGLTELPRTIQLHKVLSKANYFSLPFSVLKLQSLLQAKASADDNIQETAGGSNLFDAIVEAASDKEGIWRPLIVSIEPNSLQQIHSRLASEILKIAQAEVDNYLTALRNGTPFYSQCTLLQTYLRILGCTSRKVGTETVSRIFQEATSRFKSMIEELGRQDCSSTKLQWDHLDSNSCADGPIVDFCVAALLHLCLAQKLPTSLKTGYTERLTDLVRTLCDLTTTDDLREETVEYVFDAIMALSDGMTPDMRSNISRIDAVVLNPDARMAFVFKDVAHPDGWLGFMAGSTAEGAHRPVASSTNPHSTVRGTQEHNRQNSGRHQPPPIARSSTPAGPRQVSSPMQAKQTSPIPFHARRWELLPDQGTSAGANDTPITLTLFGARKV